VGGWLLGEVGSACRDRLSCVSYGSRTQTGAGMWCLGQQHTARLGPLESLIECL